MCFVRMAVSLAHRNKTRHVRPAPSEGKGLKTPLMPEIIVRRASEGDLERMRAIWREAADQYATLDPRYKVAPDGEAQWETALRSWLVRADTAVLVGVIEGKPLGYLVGMVEHGRPGFLPERYGYVSELAVDFHTKQGGMGRALLKAFKGWLAEQGIAHLEARVPLAQPIAQAFWRALGAGKVYDQMWLPVGSSVGE